MKLEDAPEFDEIKKIACPACFRSLVDWIGGRSVVPFTPCAQCVEGLRAWLEARVGMSHGPRRTSS